jgi:phosphoribosylaminoimidazole-succinocarboxamide synthase
MPKNCVRKCASACGGEIATIDRMTALRDAAAATSDAVFETALALPGRRRGKVRDVYEVPAAPGESPRLLVVATDRISAFDVVMPTPVPGKGRLLTEISIGWFRFLRPLGIVPDHFLSGRLDQVPGLSPAERGMLEGRSMVCRAARVVQVECVARGYLAGSGWQEYQASGTACGVALPSGLRQCERLPEPIFTPATKAAEGHDENISFERMCDTVGGDLAARLRSATLALYRAAADRAVTRGLILADTKFEFGFALGADGEPTGELMLVDEVLTPDSSRYWPGAGYAPGKDQPSFDKQYLRNWLLGEVAAGRWRKEPPGPALPANVLAETQARYEEAARLLA